MKFTNKAYNVLKPVALIVLPALGTLYFALSQIWGLPDAAEVVGSITAVDTFLGTTLHLSSVQYGSTTTSAKPASPDGNMVVDPVAGSVSLELNTDPGKLVTLEKGAIVSFQVVQKPNT